MANVIDLTPRLPRAMPRPINPPPPAPPIEVCGYELAAIHEGVPLTLLISALNRHGLTVSNIRGHGLVIHRIGQDPRRPSPLGAS